MNEGLNLPKSAFSLAAILYICATLLFVLIVGAAYDSNLASFNTLRKKWFDLKIF